MMKFYESAHSFVQSHAHIPVTMKYKINQDLYQLTRAHPSLTSTPNPTPPPTPSRGLPNIALTFGIPILCYLRGTLVLFSTIEKYNGNGMRAERRK